MRYRMIRVVGIVMLILTVVTAAGCRPGIEQGMAEMQAIYDRNKAVFEEAEQLLEELGVERVVREYDPDDGPLQRCLIGGFYVYSQVSLDDEAADRVRQCIVQLKRIGVAYVYASDWRGGHAAFYFGGRLTHFSIEYLDEAEALDALYEDYYWMDAAYVDDHWIVVRNDGYF